MSSRYYPHHVKNANNTIENIRRETEMARRQEAIRHLREMELLKKKAASAAIALDAESRARMLEASAAAERERARREREKMQLHKLYQPQGDHRWTGNSRGGQSLGMGCNMKG